jgi:hypothetical protein
MEKINPRYSTSEDLLKTAEKLQKQETKTRITE